MEQNQNPQQPDMQGQQYYQYGYDQTEQNQVQQLDQSNAYNQPYGQDMQSANQQYYPYGQGAQNAYQQYNPYGQEYQQPSYSPVAVKKRVNPAVIIVPIAILAVAAVVVALIVLLNGKGGYKGAEEKYFSQMFGGMSSALSETEKVSKDPQKIAVNFEVLNSQITDYIGLSDITFTAETAVKGKDIYALLNFADRSTTYNGKLWFDGEKGDVLMTLPEISSVYLRVSTQNTASDAEKAMAALKDVMSQTLETYFEVVGDTGVERGQTLVVNGETYTADMVKIKLDSAQLATVVKAFLESFINNDYVMDILCTYYEGSKEEVLESLDIEGAIDELDGYIEGKEDSSAAFEMTVWLQGGNIIGREVEITDEYGYTATAFDFYQIPSSDGTVTYFATPDGLEFINEDKTEGKLHSGTITVSDGIDKATVKYKDLAITDELFQGEAKVVAAGSEAFEVTVELEKEGDTKTVLISVPNIFKVTVTAEPSQLGFEDIPQPSEDEVVVMNSDGSFDEDSVAYNQFLNDLTALFWNYVIY